MAETPNFVAKKSAWCAIRWWHILLFFLVVPLICMICSIIIEKSKRIEFYDKKIVQKSGVFDIDKKTAVFTAVLSVWVEYPFWGRILGYGNVKVDMVGPWGDFDLNGVKKPKKLQRYLETRIANIRGMHQLMGN